MSKFVTQHLRRLQDEGLLDQLMVGQVGIEKECLRITESGSIAQTDHPRVLGSALKHPYITTDYSEALLEFVTPPMESSECALGFLEEVHRYVYPHLKDECLWTASMPCRVQGEQSIRIAEYGTSNLGMMKNVYRRGLGYRYGKIMQVIAGIHINLSMLEAFWPAWHAANGHQGQLQDFISEQYFVSIRNLQRLGWLVPYLFGASPAIDRSFVEGAVAQDFHPMGEDTLVAPYATSLRLGDIGYTNHRENEIGIKACYDSLDAYVRCLRRATETPYRPYDEIGVKVIGEYRQLNANLLQIENEYYSTVRPKQLTENNEKSVNALAKRGVRYVELRSMDINPCSSIGLELEQLKFTEVLFVYCLLDNPNIIDSGEREEIDLNAGEVSHYGRRPGLTLRRQGKNIGLRDWGIQVLDQMVAIAEVLDANRQNNLSSSYLAAVHAQYAKFEDVEATPAACMLQTMRDNGLSYFEYIREKAGSYCKQARENPLDAERENFFNQIAIDSLEQQKALEAMPQQDFGQFLDDYFNERET